MTTLRIWTVGPTWTGDDAFILCGGTSVDLKAVEAIKDRPRSRLIAINSTYISVPWADMLFFADGRWWNRETRLHPDKLNAFPGLIVTIARHTKHAALWHLRQRIPTAEVGLSRDRGVACLEKTSLTGALNICLHKGAKRIILIGADNRDGPDKRIHFHAEYPWTRKEDTWRVKEAELALTVAPLAKAGIEVINASPVSTLPWWPKVKLADWLKENPSC